MYHDEGRPRALAHAMLADRPPIDALSETGRGYQAAGWRLATLNDRSNPAEDLRKLVKSPLASELIDVSKAIEAHDKLGLDTRPGQSDELRLRRGLLRSAPAANFVRKVSGWNE